MVVAVCSGVLRRWVETLRGDPRSVTFEGEVRLPAIYVRPGSPWHKA